MTDSHNVGPNIQLNSGQQFWEASSQRCRDRSYLISTLFACCSFTQCSIASISESVPTAMQPLVQFTQVVKDPSKRHPLGGPWIPMSPPVNPCSRWFFVGYSTGINLWKPSPDSLGVPKRYSPIGVHSSPASRLSLPPKPRATPNSCTGLPV